MGDPDKPKRITVEVTRFEGCLNGHAIKDEPTGVMDVMILHECGEYTWESGNYCIDCGGKLR